MATAKKTARLKEPVRVRTKKLADGSESYYLDIYVDGKRSYEFLKLYHLPEINPLVKEQNRATRAAVETIKSQRIIELTNAKAGLKRTAVRSKMLLDDWMKSYLADQERKGARGLKLLRTVMRMIPLYKKKVKMSDIDKERLCGLSLHRAQCGGACRGYPGKSIHITAPVRACQGAGIKTRIPDHRRNPAAGRYGLPT